MAAASKGYGSIALALLNAGANAAQVDLNKECALVYAYKARRHKMMKLLIQNRAPVDCMDEGGRSLLMRASVDGESDVVTLLCVARANTETRLQGFTALVLAVRQIKPDCVRELVEGRADPNFPGPKGVTPLMYAAAAKHPGMILNQNQNPTVTHNSTVTLKQGWSTRFSNSVPILYS